MQSPQKPRSGSPHQVKEACPAAVLAAQRIYGWGKGERSPMAALGTNTEMRAVVVLHIFYLLGMQVCSSDTVATFFLFLFLPIILSTS